MRTWNFKKILTPYNLLKLIINPFWWGIGHTQPNGSWKHRYFDFDSLLSLVMIVIQPCSYRNTQDQCRSTTWLPEQIRNNSLQSKFYGSRQHSVSIVLTICKITSFQHTISSLQTVPDMVVSIHIRINFHIAPRALQ